MKCIFLMYWAGMHRDVINRVFTTSGKIWSVVREDLEFANFLILFYSGACA